MKNVFKRDLLFFFLIVIVFQVKGQSNNRPTENLVVDKPVPFFQVNNILYFRRGSMSSEEFRGKWLILDFFSSGCASCVESFPKTNRLSKEFADDVQFLMVGFPDRMIRPMFERFRQKERLNLPVVFDSSLFRKFDVLPVPFIVIIDNEGTVRAITYSVEESDIKDLLACKTPVLGKGRRAHESTLKYGFDQSKPFLLNDNGGNDSDFVFRSVFSNWKEGMPKSYLNDDLSACLNFEPGKLQILGVELGTLYKFAYLGYGSWWGLGSGSNDSLYGKYYPVPDLETNNPQPFKRDLIRNRNIYCYSSIFPIKCSNSRTVMKMMQRDLANYFPYHVSIETREMPYWKIISNARGVGKLKTKGGINVFDVLPHAGVTAINQPFSNVLRLIRAHHDLEVFIDETGITDNIDITLDCIFTDLNDVKRALKENGLDLVKGKKLMGVLVIRDSR